MAGRIRTIKPELIEDEAAAGLSDIAWRIWVSTFLLADDYGNYRANARWVRSQVLWSRPDASDEDVENALHELSICKGDGNGLVQLYTVRGQRYAHITGWHHQKVDKPGKPRCPGPEEADQSAHRESGSTPREDSRDPREDSRDPREDSRLTGTSTSTHDLDRDQRPSTALAKVSFSPEAERRVVGHYVGKYPERVIQADLPENRRLIRKRLEQYSPEQLCAAIDGNAASEFHQKHGHTSIPQIFRQVENVDKFIALARAPPQVVTKKGKELAAVMKAPLNTFEDGFG